MGALTLTEGGDASDLADETGSGAFLTALLLSTCVVGGAGGAGGFNVTGL